MLIGHLGKVLHAFKQTGVKKTLFYPCSTADGTPYIFLLICSREDQHILNSFYELSLVKESVSISFYFYRSC